jgi:hypothetical protein
MGRNKRRKPRNLNGLHAEDIQPPPCRLEQLPPPTSPIQDMKLLLGEHSVASLLECGIQRLGFL